MHMFDDNLDNRRISWWQIGITLFKRLDPKIVPPHRCQILRFMNNTPPQSGSEHSTEETLPKDFQEILLRMLQNFKKILNKYTDA